MLKHYATNRKRRLSALPNVGTYIYTTLKFLALQGAPYIYDISRLRVNTRYESAALFCISGYKNRSDAALHIKHSEIIRSCEVWIFMTMAQRIPVFLPPDR
jgi:hypothetical protein